MASTSQVDTTSAKKPLGGPAASATKPLVVCVQSDPEDFQNASAHLSARFDLLWSPDDSRACALLKARSDVAAVVMQIELTGSRLDGLQLAKLMRGALDPDGLPSLPEYASTVPPCPRLPIIFLTENVSRHTRAIGEIRHAKLFPRPVDYDALARALESVTLVTPSSPSSRVLKVAARSEMSDEELRRLIASHEGLWARVDALARCDLASPVPEQGWSRADSAAGQAMRAHVVCTAVADLMPDGAPTRPATAGPGLELAFGHVVRRAAIAGRLAELWGLPRATCFALGLLLECGLLARGRHSASSAHAVAATPGLWRALRESAAGDVPHNITSAHLARSWGVEEPLVAAVEQHHHELPPACMFGRVAWLSERLAAVHEAGDLAYNEQVALLSARQVGLDAAITRVLLAELPAGAARAAAALGRPLQTPSGPNEVLAELDRSYRGVMRLLSDVAREKDALSARLRAANLRLAEYASTDLLTRLANRQAFEATLRRKLEVANRVSLPLSVIIGDLDRFSRVNQEHGEQMGDEVLCNVADLVRGSVRSGDYCARYGGEEFAVILLGSGPQPALLVAERIRERIGAMRVASRNSGRAVRVTASFGVAVVEPPAAEDDASRVTERACLAMTEAKVAGCNRVRLV